MPSATPPPRLTSGRPLPPRPAASAGRPAIPRRPVGAGRAPVRARPDPNGHRLVVLFGGVAAASALVTAILTPTTPATATDQAAAAADPAPIQHVTRYVQLLPGQTAPPDAAVAPAPAATPRVVVVTTRQSGTKR